MHCLLLFLSLSAFSTDDEIQEMIDEADRDNDGKINAEEFFRVMKKRSMKQRTSAALTRGDACISKERRPP